VVTDQNANGNVTRATTGGAEHSHERFDVAIVGGGVIGLSCAWRAAQRGLAACVIEREALGAGASSVAAGMLAPVGEASWGEERLLELNLASARMFADFADELQAASLMPVPYRRCGALHVATDRDEAEELRRRLALHESLELDSEWLLPSECRTLEPSLSPDIGPGLHARDEAEIDPRALIAALRGACVQSGVALLVGSEVSGLLLSGNTADGVRLDDGREIPSAHVVVAAGAWSGAASWLPEDVRPPVRPVKGEVVRLRGASGEQVLGRIVASERVYIVPREGGEVVLGATVQERGFDTTVTAAGVHELLREAYRAVPETAELEFVEASAGLRPGTPDNTPIIGETRVKGLLLASGHYRNGVLLAPITAEIIGSLLAGSELPPSAAAVSPARFVPTGEAGRGL